MTFRVFVILSVLQITRFQHQNNLIVNTPIIAIGAMVSWQRLPIGWHLSPRERKTRLAQVATFLVTIFHMENENSVITIEMKWTTRNPAFCGIQLPCCTNTVLYPSLRVLLISFWLQRTWPFVYGLVGWDEWPIENHSVSVFCILVREWMWHPNY